MVRLSRPVEIDTILPSDWLKTRASLTGSIDLLSSTVVLHFPASIAGLFNRSIDPVE